MNKNYHEHTEPLFKSLNILPFEKLIQLHKLQFMHTIEHNTAPHSFVGTWAKNGVIDGENGIILRNMNDYKLPPPRTEQFKKSPLYSLPLEWNNFNHNETKQIISKIQFKKEVKRILS